MQSYLKDRGEMSFHAGLSAEAQVARDYQRRGYREVCQRWKGKSGEIDIITRDDYGLVFIEVKKAHDFATAAARLSQRQMRRIYASAEEFLAGEPDGLMTEVRVDVALVDGAGRMDILENAFGH